MEVNVQTSSTKYVGEESLYVYYYDGRRTFYWSRRSLQVTETIESTGPMKGNAKIVQ